MEELLVERGVGVDHVTSTGGCSGSPRCWPTPPRFARHSPGDRWFVDETYVKVNGIWRYIYRAVDQHGQAIDVRVSTRRDTAAARRFFHRALTTLKVTPTNSCGRIEWTTDRDNAKAQRFYEKIGVAQNGNKLFYRLEGQFFSATDAG